MKLKHKLFLSYLIIAVIPVFTLGIYSYSQASDFLLKQAKINLSEIAKKMADNIDYKFKRYNNVIGSIAFNSRILEIYNTEYDKYYLLYKDLKETVDPLLSTVKLTNSDIRDISIYTGNDRIGGPFYYLYSVNSLKEKIGQNNLPDDSKIRWHCYAKGAFGIIKLPDQRSGIENFLYVELDYDKVFDTAGFEENKEYGVFVCDENGNIVFSKNLLSPSYSSLKENEIVSEGKEELAINGVTYLIAQKDIPEISWKIYYYSPLNIIITDARSIIIVTVGITAACFLFLIFIVWIFSATFVKRINNLNNKMKAAANGNLDMIIQSDSKDEIGELTNGLGYMLSSLNTMIDKVYRSGIKQKEAEMRALQAQINPHFLYNTISLINWRAIKIKDKVIIDIATNISKYYRTTLNRGSSIINVKDEFENIRAYIDIQLMMHSYSFDVVYDIEEEIYGILMINTILQPIVENAIEHGIDGKEEGRGILRIGGYFAGDCIEIVIEDNGPGMEDEILSQVFIEKTRGYGMKNVQDRIKLYYGEDYGLSIQSKPNEGTRVIVRLPEKI